MAYIISESSTACDACRPVCPVDVISKGDPIYTINADTCTDCGLCEPECQVDAISQA